MKKFSLFLIILMLGCQKEDNNINPTRNDFVGYYCGEYRSTNSWGDIFTDVFKSETDSNKIIFERIVGGDSLEAIVYGYNLLIPEQTHRGWGTTSVGWWGEDYYFDVTIYGEGTLDKNNYLIQGNIHIKETYDNGTEYNEESVFKMYDCYKYSYTGTFTGDSTTVVISQHGDSLLLSITFWKDQIPKGWKNAIATDDHCLITFSMDSIADISSGKIYQLYGYGHKMGDSLRFFLYADYNNNSEIYSCNFRVGKTE